MELKELQKQFHGGMSLSIGHGGLRKKTRKKVPSMRLTFISKKGGAWSSDGLGTFSKHTPSEKTR